MIHGDVVTMTSEGILVHGKALQPLGIFDQSICWAIWAANPYILNQRGEPNAQYKYPNLIISPIHPDSWPFLLQLEIAISDKEGAFAEVCKLLQDNDLSILFIECTTAGYSHAFCNVIAESTKKVKLKDLREKKKTLDRQYPRVRIIEDDFKAAQELANKIAAEMFAHAQEIEAKLNATYASASQSSKPADEAQQNEKENDPSEPTFLHSWEVEKDSGKFLYLDEAVIELMREEVTEEIGQAREDYFKRQSPKTAKVRYMQRLAYFSLYGGGVDVPFPLKYDANSALLKLEKSEIFPPDGIKIYGESQKPFNIGKLPRPAISIFDSQEKYLRLKPVTSVILKEKLTRIDVNYRVESSKPDDIFADTSRGFLHWIGAKLGERNINLLHVSNKSTRYDITIKEGLVSFIADVPQQNYPALKEAVEAFNNCKPARLKDVSIRRVGVHEYPQRRLFLSLHFGHPRQDEIIGIIKQVALEMGFEDSIVETYVAPATQTILEKIGGCQAFLQMLLFKGNDNPSAMRFSWLDFEYGVASGKGLPSVRLVDVVRVDYDWWQSRITTNPDQRIREFRSDTSVEQLTSVIRKAIGELAQELLRRQQETG